MPGLMTTVLNLGCSGDSFEMLSATHGKERAERLLLQFLKGLREVTRNGSRSNGPADARRLSYDSDSSLETIVNEVHRSYSGALDLNNPLDLLIFCVEGVFQSWYSEKTTAFRRRDSKYRNLQGTAVLVQQMVLGTHSGFSGAGVAFSRDPASGSNELAIDFLEDQQGDVVVGGLEHPTHAAEFCKRSAEIFSDLEMIAARLLKSSGAERSTSNSPSRTTTYIYCSVEKPCFPDQARSAAP